MTITTHLAALIAILKEKEVFTTEEYQETFDSIEIKYAEEEDEEV